MSSRARTSPGEEKGEIYNDIFEKEELVWLAENAKQILLKDESLLRLKAPVYVVGDIHGQFSDLLRVFKLCGEPPKSKYLFLGDYVDRGKFGIECITYLCCFKMLYPDCIYMTRGNHESASINRIYGFYEECKNRIGQQIWVSFCSLFDCLPVAAIISNRIFCVHGGLSPRLSCLDAIAAIERPTEVPDNGLLNDLLWSDPDADVMEWGESDRGISFVFGPEVIDNFLGKNDFDLIVRAHQVVEVGYEFFHQNRLLTLFTAPNYCNEFDNAGAVLHVGEDLECSIYVLQPLQEDIVYMYDGNGKSELASSSSGRLGLGPIGEESSQ